MVRGARLPVRDERPVVEVFDVDAALHVVELPHVEVGARVAHVPEERVGEGLQDALHRDDARSFAVGIDHLLQRGRLGDAAVLHQHALRRLLRLHQDRGALAILEEHQVAARAHAADADHAACDEATSKCVKQRAVGLSSVARAMPRA